MTTLLQRAFQRAGQLPSQTQDSLAAWILDEIASEQRWDGLFEQSQDLLAAWAGEAIADYESGETVPTESLWEKALPA